MAKNVTALLATVQSFYLERVRISKHQRKRTLHQVRRQQRQLLLNRQRPVRRLTKPDLTELIWEWMKVIK